MKKTENPYEVWLVRKEWLLGKGTVRWHKKLCPCVKTQNENVRLKFELEQADDRIRQLERENEKRQSDIRLIKRGVL